MHDTAKIKFSRIVTSVLVGLITTLLLLLYWKSEQINSVYYFDRKYPTLNGTVPTTSATSSTISGTKYMFPLYVLVKLGWLRWVELALRTSCTRSTTTGKRRKKIRMCARSLSKQELVTSRQGLPRTSQELRKHQSQENGGSRWNRRQMEGERPKNFLIPSLPTAQMSLSK